MQFFYLGETWKFDLGLQDLAGQEVEFKISDLSGSLRHSSSDVVVEDGSVKHVVAPSAQTGFFAPAFYIAQVKLTGASGEVSLKSRVMFAVRKAD